MLEFAVLEHVTSGKSLDHCHGEQFFVTDSNHMCPRTQTGTLSDMFDTSHTQDCAHMTNHVRRIAHARPTDTAVTVATRVVMRANMGP